MRKHKPPWLKRFRLAVTGVVMAITMAVAPAAMADLNGVDISGYQSADIPSAISADFVIVKATQGLYWSNNNYATQLANADRTGKETGVYHFANGGNATAEADTFVNAVAGRVGRSILALDWEQCLAYGRYGCATANPNWGNPAWIQIWVTRVHDRTQVWPIVYVQRSAVWQVNTWVRQRCMLWVAQYANSQPTGYQPSPWNGGASGEGMTQYASTGYINGRGPLDLNRFYGDRTAWKKIACGERAGCSTGTVTTAPQVNKPAEQTPTDLNVLADKVIHGDYGNGQERINRLGGNYNAVMAIVNSKLGGGSSTQTTVTRTPSRTYVVRSGDTVSAIAERTGLKPASAWRVPSGNINRIYVGQTITYYGSVSTTAAPSTTYYGSTHVVGAGESLWKIYGSGWYAAAQRNGLRPPYTIYPGQRLR